jgi:hypothetical protein
VLLTNPGFLAGTLIGNATANQATAILSPAEEQGAREGLALMHDAGYDLAQAPEAWWILATKEGKQPHTTQMPTRARYLYQVLATTWSAT